MNKELYVSATPHETKVGITEDDQLAEIYLERENEYTLAGSIYKGRVTRVLPGMQSAFVDIGLERDAFLYVSDFMEMAEEDDVDDVPTTNRPTNGSNGERSSEPRAPQMQRAEAATDEAVPSAYPVEEAEGGDHPPSNGGAERDNRGGFRGRRRRRGRRPERGPEPRLARPVEEATAEAPRPERPERFDRPERHERTERHDRPARNERSDFGPPPGYQPIILPGESISKYARLAQTPPQPRA